MNNESRHDYKRVKVSALQQLASGGDTEAARELERRGVTAIPAVDIARMDDAGLRKLVSGWKDGAMPTDRAHSKDLAMRAQHELEIRYRVDDRLHARNGFRGTAPTPPAPPPWAYPTPTRCEDWQRPEGSKLYPSDAQVMAGRFNDLAKRQ